MKEPASIHELLNRSLLGRESQAERQEILRHKWFESEKAGRDIGFDLAQVDWIIKHHSRWVKERRLERMTFEI